MSTHDNLCWDLIYTDTRSGLRGLTEQKLKESIAGSAGEFSSRNVKDSDMYCSFRDGRCFFVIEAPNREAVLAAHAGADMPCDEIVEVKEVTSQEYTESPLDDFAYYQG